MEAKIKSLKVEKGRREKPIAKEPPENRRIVTLDYADTHREIVEKCTDGDRQAQFELYQLYSRAMFNLCCRMVKDELEAEDILQTSFIQVFSKINTFQFQSSIGAWIKRIVVNNCINHLKRRQVYFEELDDRHGAIAEPVEPPTNSVGMSVEAVKAAMVQLPDGYRIVFSLYLLEGYDHKEIAEILDITEATSKSQYSRAKKKIREIIESRPMASNF